MKQRQNSKMKPPALRPCYFTCSKLKIQTLSINLIFLKKFGRNLTLTDANNEKHKSAPNHMKN